MSKTIRTIPSLLLAATILYGCSSTPKEDQSMADMNKNSQVAFSDSSAPLPPDSSDISDGISGGVPDSLRHLQTKVPVDRQIKDEEPETVKIQPPVQEVRKVVKNQGNYAVQLGAFSSDANASDFALTAQRKLGKNLIVKLNPDNGLFVVRLEGFMTRFDAEKAAKDLKKKNFKDVFIVTTKE
ncbi:MAG: SPOR domain-containing protein [Ignavibacteria bacterium]|jgi:cell division protein FtsN|nr:SPOR domain-containing protein [Ignavibacteria bacterium]MCU7499658.1 SPOR domain-containing protein [Ignavibacteria bacterium]MCU7512901.1 SPOR domain-containing protein [Ignavibacteria bacterium]MCU7521421.1 SPOR domain-containing protein [Ignavibacteria bacterium]MCU7526394.1 SPOR domain-containing protein [Ignavibacteria bacterium]